ncbi:hypothetical protein [Methylococcus capsulatus]|uniref:hypothetical protein n=1 Tax=Methylococcus capsulatus TaxID=414 RepID=UPI001C53359B|nr:hypothetical protein [Methylococcus capsulatus]QXP88388.1 hypothetical protein KW112_04455 [Methylococcus capsulatus]QXP94595.1 hypothetical protein KW113_05265 [Methylococcus capsulatus]UQN13430.1 hypothetical protein M3M30_06180 [Methylococcus capsulatus]
MGLDYKPGVSKEHWKRIWALSRRLSTPGLGDEYDNLKPVADLRKQLQDRLYVLLQNPLRWDPAEPTDDAHKQQVFDGLANALSAKTLDLATRRVRAERMPEWQSAFNQSGRGSSYARVDHWRAHLRASSLSQTLDEELATARCEACIASGLARRSPERSARGAW